MEDSDCEDQSEQSMESLEYLLRRSMVARNKQTIITHENGTTTFACVECPMKYTDKESMELHLCMHNKEYRFLCVICGTGLKRKEHLERHVMGHQEIRPYSCVECGKAFKRKEHLNIHSAIHTGEKNLSCSLCDRTYHRKDHLQKHMLTHNNKLRKQEVIADDEEEEDESFGSQFEPQIKIETPAEASVQLSTFNPERPYSCDICFKSYKRKDHLRIHSWSHIKKDKLCPQCGKAFHRDEQLAWHMKSHEAEKTNANSDEELQIVDDQSWQPFEIDPGSLLIPRITMTVSEADRPHECDVCHKRFKRKQHLRAHASVHKRDIWCSLCNEGFHTNIQFENHECSMLNNTENINEEQMIEQTDECEVIEEPQTTKSKKERTESTVPIPERVFVCKYCSKPFRRRDHYKIHLNIHTGHRAFFCPECGKGFYRKDHLQKHVPIHFKSKKVKKEIPDLFPISLLKKSLPEITIHAPSNSKLRLPLKMKVPYEVVTSTKDGEKRSIVNPHESTLQEITV